MIGKSIEFLSKRCFDLLHNEEIGGTLVVVRNTPEQTEHMIKTAQKDEGGNRLTCSWQQTVQKKAIALPEVV